MISAALVSEGGAFRGLYAGGVMDSLLKHELYCETTGGVSAGALCASNYVSRQYRRTLTLNRLYRGDSRYVGRQALHNSGALIDVGFIFSEEVQKKCPFDKEQFYHGGQRLYIVATDCRTGMPTYFSKEDYPLQEMLRASTAMPFVMPMAAVGDGLYLDGGLTDYNPALWALKQGYEKVVVVASRPLTYRKKEKSFGKQLLEWQKYRQFPHLMKALEENEDQYNRTRRVLQQLEAEGKIFVLQPSDPSLSVSRLERDIEKLTDWYLLGERDTDDRIDALKRYLEI